MSIGFPSSPLPPSPSPHILSVYVEKCVLGGLLTEMAPFLPDYYPPGYYIGAIFAVAN